MTAQLRRSVRNLERDARERQGRGPPHVENRKAAPPQKIAREQQLSVAVEELRKLSRGNKEGGSFSSKTFGLRLPVAEEPAALT